MTRQGNGNLTPLNRLISGTPVGAEAVGTIFKGDHGYGHGVTLSWEIAGPAPGQV